MNGRFKCSVLLAILLALLSTNLSALAQGSACSAEVTLRNNILHVRPTDEDDTENIQCALNEAKALRVATIGLEAGNYYLRSLVIEDFRGTIQGGGIDATRVEVLDGSIDCALSRANGRLPAAMKFIKGDVTMHLTCMASNLC